MLAKLAALARHARECRHCRLHLVFTIGPWIVCTLIVLDTLEQAFQWAEPKDDEGKPLVRA